MLEIVTVAISYGNFKCCVYLFYSPPNSLVNVFGIFFICNVTVLGTYCIIFRPFGVSEVGVSCTHLSVSAWWCAMQHAMLKVHLYHSHTHTTKACITMYLLQIGSGDGLKAVTLFLYTLLEVSSDSLQECQNLPNDFMTTPTTPCVHGVATLSVILSQNFLQTDGNL